MKKFIDIVLSSFFIMLSATQYINATQPEITVIHENIPEISLQTADKIWKAIDKLENKAYLSNGQLTPIETLQPYIDTIKTLVTPYADMSASANKIITAVKKEDWVAFNTHKEEIARILRPIWQTRKQTTQQQLSWFALARRRISSAVQKMYGYFFPAKK